VICPACGLALPAYARFCARCGAPQETAPLRIETWVIVVLGVGVVLTAGVAILYSAIALYPSTASTMDPATLRTGSVILASALGFLCLLQSAAIAGLVRGREWGRVAATAACVTWSLTCVGVPVAILILTSIWRARPASVPSRTLDSRG
jgi:hypothetical protein